MSPFRFALLTALALLLPTSATANELPSMTVTGAGVVKTTPDEGYITVGVSTVNTKSDVAVRENSKTVKGLYDALAKHGVKEPNIQTVEFSIHENYKTVYEDEARKMPKQVRDGYVVRNVLSVTVCELEKFGQILDAISASGANSVHSISFGSSKTKDLLDEARKKAVAEAIRKAKLLTSEAGCELGRVLSLSEDSYGGRPRMAYERSANDGEGRPMDVPISGGSLTYSIHVTIRYELRNK